ncbi:hypothetical protein BDZ97DRAFT_1790990 [Flammula alnicola]|nr:hypothetical protein BDZ97DRAFT_1790990 [Flammula alnicola]
MDDKPKPSIHDIIPPELLGEIVGYLSTDIKCLKALALASRSFVAVSQRQIFASLDIHADSPNGEAQKLLSLLSQSPHLATYTTHLTLSDNSAYYDDSASQIRDDTLCPLLPLFKNLTRFSLSRPPYHRSRWSIDISSALLDAFLATLRQPVPLSFIYHLSPSVKKLDLWEPLVDWEPIKPPIQLRSLLIDGATWFACRDSGETIRWILQSGLDLSGVQKLGMGLFSCDLKTHEDVFKLLKACAGSLEELSISPSFEEIPPTNRIEYITLSTEYTVYPTVHGHAFFGVEFQSYQELEKTLTPRTPDPGPETAVVLWTAMSIAPYVKNLRRKGILEYKCGLPFRQSLFPAKLPS